MTHDDKLHSSTRCVHSGLQTDPATGAVAPPIHPATTYVRHHEGPYIYSRMGNPNRDALEHAVADLEGGAAALAFGSGSAAITAVLAGLPVGSHALFPDDHYMGTRMILWNAFEGRVTGTEVDMTDLAALKPAITPQTRLVWLETPSNPLHKITDLAEAVRIIHEAGAIVVVDNTWPTPLLQRPFDFGADVIVHSASKYMGGHSDVLMGIAVFRETNEFFERVRNQQWFGGGVPSPMDCWMVRRGIMSMHARMRMHCGNARALAPWLAEHPAVERVYYAGLPTHPGHELAKRQMRDFGAMISFTLKAGEEAAKRVPQLTRLIRNATSLGGVESLMEHRATAEGPKSPTPRNLIRFSVGLEDPADLMADLDQAMQ